MTEITAATETPGYFSDPDLAALLSRLAALHGHAVPAYRFGMTSRTEYGQDLDDLPRHQRAIELWNAYFALAQDEILDADAAIPRQSYPLLWVALDDSAACIVRGRLADGQYSIEDATGAVGSVAPEELKRGRLMRLTVGAAPHNKEDLPRTATEWFAFTIRKYRRVFIESVFASLVVSVIGLVAGLYSMQVYDRVIPTKGYSTLWVLTVGALIALALELLIKQVRTHMIDKTCKVIDQELSAVFFAKALDIRMDARPRTVGTFASQIRHFESVRNFMTASTLFILADAPFALFFIGVIGLLAGPVVLVPLIMVPLAVCIGLVFRKQIEKYTGQHMAESNLKNGLLIQAVDGIESLKAVGAEWKLLDRWRKMTATIAENDSKLKGLTALSTNLTQAIQQLNYVGLVAAGAYAVTQGSLTQGGLLACTIISGRALSPLMQMPNLLVQWKQAQIALKSLDNIMAMPSDREPDQRLVVPQGCQGHLELKEAGFAYDEGRPVLEVPQLVIPPGQRVAVVGSVGSGKTTLIKLLSGLYKPSAGVAFLDHVDMMQMAPEFVREHIGYLPQDVRLFEGTLRDNLLLGLPLPADSQILKAAALTGLDRVIQSHPKGLELPITEGGRGLSGGQRQLVGLTRMLLAQPRVLLLDEPTASMDAQTETRVMKHLFQEIPADHTLIVVTHKISILPLVQRVIVIDRGRIVLDGPREEVMARMRNVSNPNPTAAAAPRAAAPLAPGGHA